MKILEKRENAQLEKNFTYLFTTASQVFTVKEKKNAFYIFF